MKLLFGVAFVYEDVDPVSNINRRPKADLGDTAFMHDVVP